MKKEIFTLILISILAAVAVAKAVNIINKIVTEKRLPTYCYCKQNL